MKKIKYALLKSLFFVVIIHLICVLILYVNDVLDIDDLQFIAPVTISALFFPSLLSFYFFDIKKKIDANILKPSLLSLIIVYLIIFIFNRFINNNLEYTFFQLSTIFPSIISFFISFLFTILQIIKIKSKYTSNFNIKDFKYSYLKIFLIPLSGALVYGLFIVIDKFNYHDLVLVFYKFLPIGFIFSLLSIHFFNYVYSKYDSNKRMFYIILYYVLSISILVSLIIISFNDFRIVKDGLGAVIAKAFLIPSIILYSPFFLYVLILTHLYFVSIISKQEKSILTQQSLESQLNYQQLKNQLSPHFLFNNINVLTSLIEENPKKAISFSENLSHIYRYFLEQEKQDVVLVKEEISFAKSYLELLKDRFEVGLKFTIDIDDEAQNKYIVSTILQQVLENVVKHNEISEEHTVEVNITSKENYLIIENNINPKLKTDEFVSKKGIENIKQRIAFFTDDKVRVSETETLFTIALPILETV